MRAFCIALPVALAGLLAFTGAAQAQIVNVQPLVAKVDREGPSGDLDASARSWTPAARSPTPARPS